MRKINGVKKWDLALQTGNGAIVRLTLHCATRGVAEEVYKEMNTAARAGEIHISFKNANADG